MRAKKVGKVSARRFRRNRIMDTCQDLGST
jgi:hypothetical protein